MEIKNIIIDLCGPICEVDPRRIINAFKQMGVKKAEELFPQIIHQDFLKAFEAGMIHSEEFHYKIREITGIYLPDGMIDKAWNACLVRLPLKNVRLLGTLKLNYRLFLLSNSDEINYTYFKETFSKQLGFDWFELGFTECYFSCLTGVRKPSSEAFMQKKNSHQLKIEETVFIDDTLRHVEGARKVGLKAHHLQENESLEMLFDTHHQIKQTLFY